MMILGRRCFEPLSTGGWIGPLRVRTELLTSEGTPKAPGNLNLATRLEPMLSSANGLSLRKHQLSHGDPVADAQVSR